MTDEITKVTIPIVYVKEEKRLKCIGRSVMWMPKEKIEFWEGLVVHPKEYVLPEKIKQFIGEEEVTIEKPYAIVRELECLFKLLYWLDVRGYLKVDNNFSIIIGNEKCGSVYINNARFSVDKILDYVSKMFPELSSKLERTFKHLAVTPIPLLEPLKTLMIYKVGSIEINLCPTGFVDTPIEVIYKSGKIEYKDWHELGDVRNLWCGVYVLNEEEYEKLKTVFGNLFNQVIITDKKEVIFYPDRIVVKINGLDITTYYTDRVVINVENLRKLLRR